MRHAMVWRSGNAAACLFAALVLAGPLQAASSPSKAERDLCTKVRTALKEGRSMEQITSELGTDEAQATKCLQPRSRPRKTTAGKKKNKKPKSKPAGTTGNGGTAAQTKASAQKRQPRPHPKQPLGVRVVP